MTQQQLMLMPPPASMSFSGNPLVPPAQGVPIALGLRFVELRPKSPLPLMLRVNGEWLSRLGRSDFRVDPVKVIATDWELVVEAGDVVEWHALPQGGQGSRTILQVVLVVVALAALYVDPTGTLSTQILGYGGLAIGLLNLLVPIRQQQRGAVSSPGSVYNVQLAGNQARLNEPIPVIYGRMLTFPDFAAQPYGEYLSNDQYYFALLCVGQGNFNVERLAIGNSPLSSFSDVSYNILPPGTLPSVVLANVVNAPEVANQDLKNINYVGPFAACGPGLQVNAIGFDILFGGGLGAGDANGNLSNVTASFSVEAQAIDDFGAAAGDWYALPTVSITRATITPVRVSVKNTLPAAARVQVRYKRLDAFVDNMNVQNSPTLGGQRGYLTVSAPLCPTATHIEIRIRASSQLSQFSQNRISAIVRRKLRTWSPAGGGTWGPEVETRSIAWALADVWTNATYGDGLADSRVDLQTLYTLDAVWAARQDRLDVLFDSKITSWDAVTQIAQVGRAKAFRRYGVCSVWRDQLQTLPVTAFTSRNMLPGLDVGYSLATEVTADGVLIEYFSNRSWSWETVTCPAPGVTTPVNAPRVRLLGITGSNQARRQGLYLAAQNLYRRKMPKWQTELTGLLPAFGSLVLYAPDLPGTGQAGDVVDWSVGALKLTCSEPLVFNPSAPSGHSITLMRDDGSIHPAIAVLPGPTANDVILASAPDFTLVLDDANRERPKYIFGETLTHRSKVIVLGITKRGRDQSGVETIEMTGVQENDLVHAVDNAYLPGPGVVQDPVDGGTTVPSFSFQTVVNVNARTNQAFNASRGVVLAGLDPAWVLTVDEPSGQLFDGWSEWASDYDGYVPSPPNAWSNQIKITNNTTLAVTSFGAINSWPSGAAARAAFVGGTLTGSSSYTLWINSDNVIDDNRGGLSIRLTRTA